MSRKQRFFQILEGTKLGDKRAAFYESFITGLVLISILTIFLETYENLVARFAGIFALLNLIITLVFTFDYFVRVWTADLKYPKLSASKARRKYIFSPFGIIDALATFPPYLSAFTGVNLAIFRLLRLARLLRLSKLDKINQAIALFKGVFNRKKTELMMTFGVVIILVFLAGLLMYYAEHEAQPDKFANAGNGMWWAVITLTTIGYGDLYPITPIGRMLGSCIALLGIGVIALPTGILSGGLMEELNARKEEKEKASKKR
jgi:voltage-gated potassium channel